MHAVDHSRIYHGKRAVDHSRICLGKHAVDHHNSRKDLSPHAVDHSRIDLGTHAVDHCRMYLSRHALKIHSIHFLHSQSNPSYGGERKQTSTPECEKRKTMEATNKHT